MDNNKQHRPSPDSRPVMLYLSGSDGDRIGPALQDNFGGEFRIVSPQLNYDRERSRQIVNECVAAENPQIIVAAGERSYHAMLDDWGGEVEIVVVNPFFGWNRDDIPCWRYPNVFMLCTTLDRNYRESILPRIIDNYGDIHVVESDLFGSELNEQGMQQFFSLIETVAGYHKLAGELMTLDEYEEMVRRRPKPDDASYYRLKVWSYDGSRQVKNEFSRVIVDSLPSYRRPISCRLVEFPTKDEAVGTMHAMVDAGESEICAFIIERLAVCEVGSEPLWLEAWSYDSNGNLIQEASCSAAHAGKPGVYGKFLGHLPENVKWHQGDIVQIFHHYPGDPNTYATLGIVESAPESTEEIYKQYLFSARQSIREGRHPDEWSETTVFEGADEDEMSVLTGPYCYGWSSFDFYNTMSVLPAPKNQSGDIISELKSWLADWQDKRDGRFA